MSQNVSTVLFQLWGADSLPRGNSLLLEAIGRFAVFDLKTGFHLYKSANYGHKNSAKHSIDGGCSQGISAFCNSAYIVTAQDREKLRVSKGNDASSLFELYSSGTCIIYFFHIPLF